MRESAAKKAKPEPEVILCATAERSALMEAVRIAARPCPRRATIPILANVLLEAGDDLRITGTDMENWMTARCPATMSERGRITLPGKVMCGVLAQLDDGPVTISATQDMAIITSGDFRCELMCLPADDMPAEKAFTPVVDFTIPAPDLASMIEKTRFAISTEETRYYLNGIYLHVTKVDGAPVLRAVATDGHRMAMCDATCPDGAVGMAGQIIHRDAVNFLMGAIGTGDVRIEVDTGNLVRVTTSKMVMVFKPIDGKFPDYMRVLPKNERSVRLEAAAFMRAVKRVTSVSLECRTPLKLQFGDAGLVVSASSMDHGLASHRLYLPFVGMPFEIGLQARYVRDIFARIKDHALFTFLDGSAPVTFADPEHPEGLYVLMPMRV